MPAKGVNMIGHAPAYSSAAAKQQAEEPVKKDALEIALRSTTLSQLLCSKSPSDNGTRLSLRRHTDIHHGFASRD